MPALAIAAILAATAVVGFGAGSVTSKEQVQQEVKALLAGVPQDGSTLGSPEAPITLLVYGDLQCPTVKLFFEKYLPRFIDSWVRTGVVKLRYRSLETDTLSERTFFRQEVAALAAGRQDRMWNFLLTFVHEQGEHFTSYANDEFLAEIASQVPGLTNVQWLIDRQDARLSRQVALDVYSAHGNGFRYTPSFSLEFANAQYPRVDLNLTASLREEFKASLLDTVDALRDEASGDVPALKVQP